MPQEDQLKSHISTFRCTATRWASMSRLVARHSSSEMSPHSCCLRRFSLRLSSRARSRSAVRRSSPLDGAVSRDRSHPMHID